MQCSLMEMSMHVVMLLSRRCAPQRSLCRVQCACGRRQLRLQRCDLRGCSTPPHMMDASAKRSAARRMHLQAAMLRSGTQREDVQHHSSSSTVRRQSTLFARHACTLGCK
jgi:hypothetical protein